MSRICPICKTKTNYNDIKIVNSLLEENIFPEGYFDFIIVYYVIEHIADPTNFLMLVKSFLKDDGICIIGTPNVGSVASKLFKGNFRLLGESHLTLFSEKALTKYLKS